MAKGKKKEFKVKLTSVLVVEDEDSFVDALSVGLAREGFDVHVARDGSEALQAFASKEPDLILLDLMLPQVSGLDVCREIRSKSSVPIIMVTAKGEEIDTVVGLEIGADDYVTKPYRLRELVARMRAVLRRRAEQSEVEAPQKDALELANIRLEPGTRRAFIRGEEIHLRRKEFDLLQILMENAGRVLTREVLIDRVWGDDYVGDTKTLDVHMMRLRNQIELDPKSPELITTVRGVGYRFDGSQSNRHS